MKNKRKPNHTPNNKKTFKPGKKKRENKCVVTFNDGDRQEFLTGFHKRKVQRRKVALAELRKKIKEEQSRVREERHKEYLKLFKERTDAIEDADAGDDADDLEAVITSTTESVKYDHPNHTVTVTTISDLDLTGAHLLGEPAANQVNGEEEEEVEEREDEEKEEGEEEKEEWKKGEEQTKAMPRKAGNPIMNKKIRSLTKSLSTFTSKRRRKGKQEGQRGGGGGGGGRGRERQADKRSGGGGGGGADMKKKTPGGRSTKWQRRRQTGGRGGRHHD